MSGLNVTISGVKEVQVKLMKAIEKIENVSHKALIMVGQDLLAKALMECPLDTGDLRRSGYVKYQGKVIVKGSDSGTTQSIGYTITLRSKYEVEVGFDSPYAIKQHENLEFRHLIGKAKYLEDPLKQNLTRFIEYIVKETRKELKNG
jgi:hypothetical protein